VAEINNFEEAWAAIEKAKKLLDQVLRFIDARNP